MSFWQQYDDNVMVWRVPLLIIKGFLFYSFYLKQKTAQYELTIFLIIFQNLIEHLHIIYNINAYYSILYVKQEYEFEAVCVHSCV